MKAGRLVLHEDGDIGQISDRTSSSWAGMSGAVCIRQRRSHRVVLADADATHPERCELWALLAHTFADDLSFLYWICWDGDEGGWSGPKQSDKEASIIRGY